MNNPNAYEDGPDGIKRVRDPVQVFNVYRSPEFQAFAERFGIAVGLRTTDLTIHLPTDGMMTVTQTYQASVDKTEPIDTTTQWNRTWRTKMLRKLDGSDEPVEVTDRAPA